MALRNTSYTNPILPGWHTDPSCTFVAEWDNTFFLTTSSFLTFPGCPVFASKDLVNWRLASNALSRREQVPEFFTLSSGQQQEGIWASTLRYHNGKFYLITSFISYKTEWRPVIFLFTTEDPYDDAAWSSPLRIDNPGNDIDPDIFWDDDGQAYMAVAAGIWLSKVNLKTGAASAPVSIWRGSGNRNPEGPHIYKKDGYYYLLLAEGGTEMGHCATIARSRSITGPYEGYAGNPILTATGTNAYFQTVGHADLFQDAAGNWWAIALATRSGPAWENYPMGRETVLTPVRWEKGGWPVLEPIRGQMHGPVPAATRSLPGAGPFVADGDVEDFKQGSPIPRHFVFWRPPKASLFSISPPGYPDTLRMLPSRTGLSGDIDFEPDIDGLSFISRRQTSTLFSFSVDLSFQPTELEEEAGVTVFLTQQQHIDLGIVNLPLCSDDSISPRLRFRVEASGKPDAAVPQVTIVPLPKHWPRESVRLQIATESDTFYVFSAAPVDDPEDSRTVGFASAEIVSGGTGPFTGTLIGAYATSNGGNGTTPAYFSRWRYTPMAQEISAGEFVSTETRRQEKSRAKTVARI
ncbi:Xylosidase [Pleurostoma richardsiae]|uniref:Xylosidase n=1 Tax=Pleurostoma richardsiae TaxID=41990 RepID=A0AA38VGJ1_9PEZI|nr:Xylosidase [Pleurostoma richardsiae]